MRPRTWQRAEIRELGEGHVHPQCSRLRLVVAMALDDDAWSGGEQPLGRTIHVLRERWLVIIAAGLIAAVSAYLAASTATKEYKATATLLFRSSQLGVAIGGTQVFSSSLDPNRDLATDLALVKSKEVAQSVKKSLNSSLTVDDLLSSINVTAASGADIGNVTATSTDPKRAADIANAFASAYVVNRRQADRDVVAQAEALVRQRLRTSTTADDRQALRAALTKLTTLEAVQTGSAEVSNSAGIPTTPSSPHPKRDAFIALLLGLAGGFGLSYAISVLDRHVKTAEGLERLYGLPLLATIPQRAFSARARDSHDRLEPFRILHSSIEMMLARDEAYVLLVTSALAMEGKSTVSANLGRVIAQSGHRVAVIEADLRRPTMVEHFDIGTGATGLSTALTTDRPITELLRPVDDLGRRLMILPSGPALSKPTEALRTQRMQSNRQGASAEQRSRDHRCPAAPRRGRLAHPPRPGQPGRCPRGRSVRTISSRRRSTGSAECSRAGRSTTSALSSQARRTRAWTRSRTTTPPRRADDLSSSSTPRPSADSRFRRARARSSCR